MVELISIFSTFPTFSTIVPGAALFVAADVRPHLCSVCKKPCKSLPANVTSVFRWSRLVEFLRVSRLSRHVIQRELEIVKMRLSLPRTVETLSFEYKRVKSFPKAYMTLKTLETLGFTIFQHFRLS